jgi:hypothetical protein
MVRPTASLSNAFFDRIEFAFLFVVCFPAVAQEPILRDIHVDKKSGQLAGAALATVDGKVWRISQHAVQAWPVMEGQNALVLVSEKGEYLLRFYEGATRKRRDLGAVPFASAELREWKQSDGSWAFVLSGSDGNEPLILVADVNGIHARLRGAIVSKLESETFLYKNSHTGEPRTIPLQALLATDLVGIYEAREAGAEKPHYVQFLRDGTSVLVEPDGHFRTGDWWTDGDKMVMTLSNGAQFEWPRTALVRTAGIPAGTRLTVRLLQPLSSHKAKEGDSVKAVLISPASINSKILMPQGSELSGIITKAHGVGWAVRHETAALTLAFNEARMQDGQMMPVHARLYQVENSREKVNNKGAIQGIRSTGTLGHTAESSVSSVAAVDPIAYLFTSVSATAVLGFAEPEILYPAGTELIIELTSPLVTSKEFPSTVPPLASSPVERDELARFIRSLSFRTVTKGSEKPSDLTNLLFIGPPEGLQRAFKAAGWVNADQLTANTTFETLKTITGNQVYNQAPMSILLLDERPPIFTLTKTTNTFSSRHHLRVFNPNSRFNGATVLTASSTQDIGIAFSRKHKTFIHVIDQYIDNERSKVVNDLQFTGCVQAMELVPRPWVPQDAYNSTGDRLRTDGAIAVLRINDCLNARTTPTDSVPPPSRFQRSTRDTVLVLRNDVWRRNIAYQGVTGALKLRSYLLSKNELKPDVGDWQKTDLSGAEFEGVGSLPADRQPSAHIASDHDSENASEPVPDPVELSHRWDPPRYEIGLQGGYLRYPIPRLEVVGTVLTPVEPGLPVYSVGLADAIDGGWTAGISVTANSWRWVSNEFGYHYQRGKYTLGSFSFGGDDSIDPGILTNRVGLITRQFEYNILVHARPPESRWRPYAAVGPVLQLISLSDAPVKRASGPLRLGLQNIGILKAAFDFGSTPPLEGGGIFQVGLQYGAGIKFRVHPRITLRADFRETWSQNPNFIKDSYTDETLLDLNIGYDAELFRVRPDAKFRQQRFTLGVAFTF